MEVHTLKPADSLGFVNHVNLVNLFRALLSRARARTRVRMKEVHKVHQVHKRFDLAHEFPCEPRVNLQLQGPEVHTRVNLVNLFRQQFRRSPAAIAVRAEGCRRQTPAAAGR
jgi:hypothetical protein